MIKKTWTGFKLGLILAVTLGVGRLAFFLITEEYTSEEIRNTLVNLLYGSLHQSAILSILTCLLLATISIFFRRVEGLVVSGVATGILFLPVAYFVNTRFLPGFFELTSLLGNSVLALVGLVLALLLFYKGTSEWRFIDRVGHRFTFWLAALTFAGIVLAYRVQGVDKQLYFEPDAPEELIHLFNVEALAEAGANGNGVKLAPRSERDLLTKYFDKKMAARLVTLREKIAQRDSAVIVAAADSILGRRFTFNGVTRTVAERIDWQRNPTDDMAWLFALNRQEWLWEVAAAHLLTAHPKYAIFFDQTVGSWLDQNPRLNWKNERDPAWRLIESSLRMSASWLDAFTIFFSSSDLSDKMRWRMLGSIHQHAQILAHFRSRGRNHLLQETYGLMAVAGVFPEFKMSQRWLDVASMRLANALDKEIYPDGGYIEGSTFYHRFVIRILQQIADFAEENDIRLPENFHSNLERMYTFLMYVAKPNGFMPLVNDGFWAKNLRILYDAPAQTYARDDFAYFASDGEIGEEPTQRSIAFPYSGTYVMRSDWSGSGRYLLVDAGPFGSSHGHEDKLSFELFAFGKPLIVEGGTYTYRHDRWHKYFESSFAHNTVVVDNRSQLRQPYEHRWVSHPHRETSNIWYSDEHVDFLEGTYDEGYGNRKEDILRGVEHVRRILFVKPDYWIVWDVVRGRGNRSSRQLFHLAPETTVTDNRAALRVTYSDGAGLLVKSLGSGEVRLKTHLGSEDPLQGWFSPEYGVKVPATVLDFEKSGNLPHAFLSILYPFPNSGVRAECRAELLTASRDGEVLSESEAVAIKVTTQRSTDYILMAPTVQGEKQVDNFVSDSELLLRREYADGEVQETSLNSFKQ